MFLVFRIVEDNSKFMCAYFWFGGLDVKTGSEHKTVT